MLTNIEDLKKWRLRICKAACVWDFGNFLYLSFTVIFVFLSLEAANRNSIFEFLWWFFAMCILLSVKLYVNHIILPFDYTHSLNRIDELLRLYEYKQIGEDDIFVLNSYVSSKTQKSVKMLTPWIKN